MKGRSRTILFADDEPILQDALLAVLESEGFQCISKTNMTDAWNYLCDHEVSVLVTDIMMSPGEGFDAISSVETGYHLVKKVRKEFPNVAVICLSVIGDQSIIDSLKKRGVLYLRKGETPLDTAAKLIKSKATGIYTYGDA